MSDAEREVIGVPDGEALLAEDRDSDRMVERFQAGDGDAAFTVLYKRYFDRVYAYLRTVLNDDYEAEDVAQQVFMQVFERLPQYERRGRPFRAWLFVMVRNQAINSLRRSQRLVVEDPEAIARRREQPDAEDAIERTLGWITDPDLTLFVERLPLPQRQALLCRFLLDLRVQEIAEVLDRTPNDVSKLLHRAVKFLGERLAALGREPKNEKPVSASHRPKQAVVLRERRFALWD